MHPAVSSRIFHIPSKDLPLIPNCWMKQCAFYACPGCVSDPSRKAYNIFNFRNPHDFYCDVCDLKRVGRVTTRVSNGARKARVCPSARRQSAS